MIKLKGPRTAEAGSTVCITATGVGAGFSAVATGTDGPVALKITIDRIAHSATICFVVPASGDSVAVLAKDAASPFGASHVTYSL
jgi:hypothetical protein